MKLLDKLPLRNLYRAFLLWRETNATVAWPEDAPTYTYTSDGTTPLEEVADELEQRLRDDYHFEGAPFSYNYEGEVLNLRRPEGTDSDGNQLELHVRARTWWDPELGGLEVVAHLERSRYEHLADHRDEKGFEWLSVPEIGDILTGGRVNGDGSGLTGLPRLKFDPELVSPLLDGGKNATVRYDLDRDLSAGDPILLETRRGLFGEATVAGVVECELGNALSVIDDRGYQHNAPSVERLWTDMNGYYEDDLGLSTTVEVVFLDDVEEGR